MSSQSAQSSPASVELSESTEALAALILPWAKETFADRYAETIKQASKPMTFRRYLTRLVEIRVEMDRSFIRQIPISILDETALTATVVDRKTGKRILFAGKRAKGVHALRFKELLFEKADFELLVSAWETLDLEYAPDERQQ